jgi:hypothetical protein
VTHQEESAPPSTRPIPIPEIAQRAEDVATLLRQSAVRRAPGVQDIEGQLPAASDWVRGRLAGTTRVLASTPSPNALVNLAESWQMMRARLTAWNDTLTLEARQLERRLGQLEAVRNTWAA